MKGADIALLIGARPRGPGMQRADLLKANAAIFAGQVGLNITLSLASVNHYLTHRCCKPLTFIPSFLHFFSLRTFPGQGSEPVRQEERQGHRRRKPCKHERADRAAERAFDSG
jgi:hypothetical protein